ncbi:MAG: hypothetical protein ACP5ON_10500 [Bacteroidota bacterium]
MKRQISVPLFLALLFPSFLWQWNTEKPEVTLEEITPFGNKVKGSIFSAYGIAFLPDQSIVVSDKLDYQLKKFDRFGNMVAAVGRRGKGPGEFSAGPGPIASYNRVIAAADFASPRVDIFSSDLKYQSTFYAQGPVFDLQFDAGGNLWVGALSGAKDKLLFKCNISGRVLQTVPLRNARGDMFADIFTFTINSEGKIIIAYAVQNKVEIWDTSGNFYREFSVPGLPPEPKYHLLSGGIFSKGLKVPDGNIFWRVAADRKGRIFLLCADYTSHPDRDVYVLEPSGKYVTEFELPAQSKRVQYIAIDRNGFLFTIEDERSFVKKYRLQYRGF